MQNKRPYSDYCRPKLADLLSALKLDTEYVSATGCYLQDKDGRTALDRKSPPPLAPAITASYCGLMVR